MAGGSERGEPGHRHGRISDALIYINGTAIGSGITGSAGTSCKFTNVPLNSLVSWSATYDGYNVGYKTIQINGAGTYTDQIVLTPVGAGPTPHPAAFLR